MSGAVLLASSDRMVIAPGGNTWRERRSARRKLRKLRGRLHEGVRQAQLHRRRTSLLTLTGPRELGTPAEAYGKMIAAWNAWLTWLRKEYPQVRVFRVVERQQDGYPHFHVVLFAAPYIAQKRISNHWASLLGVPLAIVDIRSKARRDGDWAKAVNYCTKYLTKAADVVAEASWWGPRVRPWSASRGLLAEARPKPEPWWSELHRLEYATPAVAQRWADHYGLTLQVADPESGYYSAAACGAQASLGRSGAGRRPPAASCTGRGVRA